VCAWAGLLELRTINGKEEDWFCYCPTHFNEHLNNPPKKEEIEEMRERKRLDLIEDRSKTEQAMARLFADHRKTCTDCESQSLCETGQWICDQIKAFSEMTDFDEGKGFLHFNKMCWPNPFSQKIQDLEWLLRYGTEEEVMRYRLLMASVMSAYVSLCHKTNPQHLLDEMSKASAY
jgi:hypothetical protein